MEEEDYTKLPIEDRCVHKVWKARVSGYEAATNLFRQIDDEKSPEWNKYLSLVKKFVVDSNAPAQEKGLEAALALVENCASAGKTAGDVMNGLVQKCVGAPKARTKELAIQLALMYIEIEKQDIVLEELTRGSENKNPKIAVGCIHIITLALQEFGAKVINISKILKRVLALLEERDKSVREEAKALLVEIYRWMGPTLKTQLTNLKQTQVAEIEAEYEKVKSQPVKPSRLLKSQQVKKVLSVESGSQVLNSETDVGGDAVEVDPYEFLDPVDILSQLPKNFYTQLEAKKWSERKEALETLDKLFSAAPKIENADYLELVKTLKKMIQKDSNVVVVGVAIKCVTGLANGLKKKFHPYSAMIMPCLFEKFKEKKQNVVVALREAVDAVYLSTNLELILEDVIAFLDNKNPSVKAEVVSFLARVFAKSTPAILNKKLLKPLTKAMLKTLTDQDQVVRENAAQALGTAMKVTGEKTISPFLTEVDNQKLAKIKECCEKAEILVRPQKTAEPARVAEKQAVRKPVGQERSAVGPSKPSATVVAASKVAQQSASAAQIKLIQSSDALQKDEALKQANELIPQNIVSGLTATAKAKIAAYKQLKEFIESQDSTLGQIMLIFLLSDDMKQNSDGEVMTARIEVIKTIVETMPVPEYMLEELALDISACLTYKESADLASATLNILTDTLTLDCISKMLLSRDLQDQPLLWARTLNWICHAVIKYKSHVDSSFLMECGKNASSHSDDIVKNAGLALIGTVHLQVQDTFVSSNSEVPTAEEPTKENVGKSKKNVQAPAIPVVEKDKDPSEDKPRSDLGTQITDQLLSELADKSWKVRSEAVTKLHQMIKDAKPITANLGELPPVLAARISDSNSKIAVASIQLVETLAEAMGPQCKQHTRTLLPALIKLIGDPKIWIRSAVITCLNTWYETGGYKEFFEGEIMADALRTGSPSLRAEVWNFLALKLPDVTPRSVPKDELMACLPTLYANIEDRNADVRKNACEAVLGFMIHLGFNTMNSACDNIKGNSGAQVKLILEKTRGSMPEKFLPPKTKIGSASAGSAKQSTIKMVAGSSATITKSVKPKGNARSMSRNKKEEEVDTGALLQVNNLKNQRIIDDHKLKTLKWNFTTPRAEFVDLLKELMITANVNKNLIANMFHSDFRFHLRAIDALMEDLSLNDLSPLINNLDLILRWMTLRFFDTNPSVLLRGLDYLNTAFRLLIADGYQMLDYEANSFIPYLILKVGDPKDAVRNSVRALFKQISSMYPVTKQFTFVMEGIKSKNARQRSECLDQLAWLIENYGMVVCQPNPPAAIKEIAKQIADRDTTVRNAALNCVVTAYFLAGERVTKMVGPIADKDMSLLEERIKRACKNRPVASVKPMQPPTSSSIEGIDQVVNSEVQMQPTPQIQPTDYIEDMDEEEDGLVAQPGINTTTTVTNGPFALDQDLINEIESVLFVQIKEPKIVKVDIDFLKEPTVTPTFHPIQMTSMTPTLSDFKQKNAVRWEITQIASSDLEKAVDSTANIDTILNSDKRTHLVGFIDFLIKQLVHQLVILNQSSLPDVVTCYKTNFSVLMRVTNYPEMCDEITENTLYKLLDRLIILLAERRLQGLDRREMFVRTINSLVFRFLDQSDKTNILCSLINLLYDSINNTMASEMYKDLVAKCLWKLNRSQTKWDSKLDYVRVLSRVNTFFRDYPSAWWKTQANDVPLRTVKTILHTMVKVRGMRMQEIASSMSEISDDSELYIYIKKLVRHLETSNTGDSHSGHKDKDSSHDQSGEASLMPLPKLTKEIRDQLAEIFSLIGDTLETSEGLKKLFAFKKAHPEADIAPFLSRTTPLFQQYIEKGLASLEQEDQVPVQGCKKISQPCTALPLNSSPHVRVDRVSIGVNLTGEEDNQEGSSKYFRKEAERLWSRLQTLKEQAGLPIDSRSLDELCADKDRKVDPTQHAENEPVCDPSLQSIRERLQKLSSKNE